MSEWLSLSKFPKDGARGQRRVPLTREIFIDRSDFREEEPPPPPASELALLSKKAQKRLRSAAFNRLTLHQPVRLRGAYVISVSEVVRDDATNEIVALRCTHDDTSLGKTIYINGAPGEGAGGESVAGGVQPGVVHWVSAERSIDAEVFVYKSLFAGASALRSGSAASLFLVVVVVAFSLLICSPCVFLNATPPRSHHSTRPTRQERKWW